MTLVGAPASSPLNFDDWGKKRLLLFFLICILPISIAVAKAPVTDSAIQRVDVRQVFYDQRRGIPRLGLIGVCTSALCSISALATGVILWRADGVSQRIVFLFLCVLVLLLSVVVLRGSLLRHIEILFLVTAITFGSFLCYSLPSITRVSWDDQIHFDRSLGLSYLTRSEYNQAEIDLVNIPEELFQNPEISIQKLNDSYEYNNSNGNILTRIGLASPISGSSLLNIATIGYIPSAIGLWIGRLFSLPLNLTFIFGKMGNLLFYTFVMAYAVRIIPIKKTVLAVIGLLPTSLFLAASYSYDPWVIAVISLGIAYIFREAFASSGRIRLFDLVRIVIILFLGLCPKAIYFPVIALLYLIPRDRFSSTWIYRRFCFVTFLFGCLMFLTFALPMLFSSSAQAGDARGGSEVNALDQIIFILSNPLFFLRTICQFLLTYISPVSSNAYGLSFAYLGTTTDCLPFLSAIPFILILSASLLDTTYRDSFFIDGSPSKIYAWSYLVFFSSIFLVATSLYISFTPVGLDTVNGCQQRYLLPVILLLFLPLRVIGNDPMKRRIIGLFFAMSVSLLLVSDMCLTILPSVF